MSHVTHTTELWHAYKWVLSRNAVPIRATWQQHDIMECTTWLIRMSSMTSSCMCHDSFPRMTSHSHYKHTAAHCNTLQHTATHYNTLQHTREWMLIPAYDIHICHERLIHTTYMCVQTNSNNTYVCTFIHVTAETNSYIQRDSIVCAIWLIHI